MKATVYSMMCIVLLLVASAQAQTPKVTANVPLTVQADHADPANTTFYIVKMDGVMFEQFPTSVRAATGVLTMLTSMGVPRGVHTVEVCAANADKSACTPPLTFQAEFASPISPTNPRLAVIGTIHPDGSVSWKLARVVGELSPGLLVIDEVG